MSEKKCPNCGLWNPPSAMRCDCGYDFDSNSIQASFADSGAASVAKERAERNLPTLVVRGVVFFAVYMSLMFAMYFALGHKPGGLLIGLAFGMAGAAAAMIKIKVKKWF